MGQQWRFASVMSRRGDFTATTIILGILILEAQIKVSSKYNATMELFFDQQCGQ